MNDSTREPPLSNDPDARLREQLRQLNAERDVTQSQQEVLTRIPRRKRGAPPPAMQSSPGHRAPPASPPPRVVEQHNQVLVRTAPAALSSPVRQVQQQSDSKDIETLTDRVPVAAPPAAPPAKPAKRRLLRFVLLFLIPLLVLLVAIWFYIHGGRYIATENAYVKANIIAVSADVSGRVTSVHVSDNEYVKAGALLFTLDTTPYEIDIAQAEADMAVVRTDIEALRADYRETLVSIEEAQEQKNHLDKELQRQQTMLSRGIGTAKDLDQARHDSMMGERRLNTQKARARQALASLNGKQWIKAEEHPRFMRAMASRRHAENALAKTRIVAPSNGVISNMKLQPGEYVDDGKPVFSLIETEPLWIEANLKETQLTHLRTQQHATFVADAYPDVTWNATIETIAPATGAEFSLLPPQNATGNWVKVVQRIPVRLAIGAPITEGGEAPAPVLRAGMTVSVSIDTKHERQLPTPLADAIDTLPLPDVLKDRLTPSSP